MPHKYHFVGVAGSGMRPLAGLLAARKHAVSGSDREFERGGLSDIRRRLTAMGVVLHPQDGAAVQARPDFVVVSAAIEDDNPEVRAARSLGIPLVRRSELLGQVLSARRAIAVAGTNGKSTVSGMITWLLWACGLKCTSIVGAGLRNFPDSGLDGFLAGDEELVCAEVDESDGTILLCAPAVGILTNLGRDHKELAELTSLFTRFGGAAGELLLVGRDCPRLRQIDMARPVVGYGIAEDADVRAEIVSTTGQESVFRVDGHTFRLEAPGLHNVSNALAAIAVGRHLGLADNRLSGALAAFKGVSRRLETVGAARGVRVIDDYAHNPYKVAASAEAVKAGAARVIAVYQPHGYGPTRFFMQDLGRSLAAAFPPPHLLYLLPIYDAGGSADRSVSSEDLADSVERAGGSALCVSDRALLEEIVAEKAREGDTVLVMGARDNTLTDLCRRILRALGERDQSCQ